LAGSSEHENESLGSINAILSGPAGRLLSSQEVFSYMEFGIPYDILDNKERTFTGSFEEIKKDLLPRRGSCL
jgi:hypothetical protein